MRTVELRWSSLAKASAHRGAPLFHPVAMVTGSAQDLAAALQHRIPTAGDDVRMGSFESVLAQQQILSQGSDRQRTRPEQTFHLRSRKAILYRPVSAGLSSDALFAATPMGVLHGSTHGGEE